MSLMGFRLTKLIEGTVRKYGTKVLRRFDTLQKLN